MLSSTRGFVPPDPAGGSASVLVICSRSALAMCHHQQSKILFRIRPVPLTPHLEVPQQPNPLTKTKLSIILTLTMIPTLTLLALLTLPNPSNHNRNSKTIKLTHLFWTRLPRRHRIYKHIASGNTLAVISLPYSASLTDFPTSKHHRVFDVHCLSGSRHVVTIMQILVLHTSDLLHSFMFKIISFSCYESTWVLVEETCRFYRTVY